MGPTNLKNGKAAQPRPGTMNEPIPSESPRSLLGLARGPSHGHTTAVEGIAETMGTSTCVAQQPLSATAQRTSSRLSCSPRIGMGHGIVRPMQSTDIIPLYHQYHNAEWTRPAENSKPQNMRRAGTLQDRHAQSQLLPLPMPPTLNFSQPQVSGPTRPEICQPSTHRAISPAVVAFGSKMNTAMEDENQAMDDAIGLLKIKHQSKKRGRGRRVALSDGDAADLIVYTAAAGEDRKMNEDVDTDETEPPPKRLKRIRGTALFTGGGSGSEMGTAGEDLKLNDADNANKTGRRSSRRVQHREAALATAYPTGSGVETLLAGKNQTMKNADAVNKTRRKSNRLEQLRGAMSFTGGETSSNVRTPAKIEDQYRRDANNENETERESTKPGRSKKRKKSSSPSIDLTLFQKRQIVIDETSNYQSLITKLKIYNLYNGRASPFTLVEQDDNISAIRTSLYRDRSLRLDEEDLEDGLDLLLPQSLPGLLKGRKAAVVSFFNHLAYCLVPRMLVRVKVLDSSAGTDVLDRRNEDDLLVFWKIYDTLIEILHDVKRGQCGLSDVETRFKRVFDEVSGREQNRDLLEEFVRLLGDGMLGR